MNDIISIIGFGYVGSALASVFLKKSKKIYGIDNDKTKIENLNKKVIDIQEPRLKKKILHGIREKKIEFTSDYKFIKKSNVIIITVGTPYLEGKTNLKDLTKTIEKLAKFVKKNSLIIIKSTVPPGTSQYLYTKYLRNKRINFCYSPERISESNLIKEFQSLPIILGGINKENLLSGERFFKKYLKVNIIKTENIVEAELAKLFDNLWIDLNISLGNEVAKISNKLNANSLNVIRYANTLKKGNSFVNILLPSIGVGGYCLNKDSWMVNEFAKKNKIKIYLPKISRKINNSMPKYVYDIISNKIKNENLKNPKLMILGYSFKSNTGDTRNTPVEKFINLLKKDKNLYDIDLTDPLVLKKEILSNYSKKIFINFSDFLKSKKKYDIIFFMNKHEQFTFFLKEILNKVKKNKLIVDGRYYFTSKEIIKLRKKFKFIGVGW